MSPKKQGIAPKAVLSLLFYLIIPSCAILLIMQSYPELTQNRFYLRIYWILPMATIIVFLASLSVFYQKGDTKRFLLNIGFVLATIIWMYGLLGGGMVMTTQWNGYSFSLHMNKYVILIVCVAVLNVMYYTFEWRVYRRDKILRPSDNKKTTGTVIE
jgi:hypothetical protein